MLKYKMLTKFIWVGLRVFVFCIWWLRPNRDGAVASAGLAVNCLTLYIKYPLKSTTLKMARIGGRNI